MLPCLKLSIIRYGSRVKWSNKGNGVALSLHLSVVAIGKEAFGSPSTMITNFNLFLGTDPDRIKDWFKEKKKANKGKREKKRQQFSF